MKTKERVFCYTLSAFLLTAIAYSAKSFFYDSFFSWFLKQQNYQAMVLEVSCFGIASYAILMKIKRFPFQVIALSVLFLIFTWMHMIFLPLLVTGLYWLYIWGIGRLLRKRLKITASWMTELLIGMLSLVLFFCILSFLQIGAITVLRWIVLLTWIPVVLISYKQYFLLPQAVKWEEYRSWERIERWIFIFTIMAFLIQIGRMNLAVDFDSAWYGIRAPYILNNGKGIYENLGTVGIVYTYSKGFEILTLPLSDLPSFSFIFAFNLWGIVIVLGIAYAIARKFTDRKIAFLLLGMVAMLPGIMNMGITAKSDVLTLLVQLIMFFYLLSYAEKAEVSSLFFSIFALLFSWTLKPTAVIFSTVIFGLSSSYFIIKKRRVQLPDKKYFWLLLLAILNLVFVWGRTLQLTGVPMTSVYSSIFVKLGFHLKYPFEVNSIPNRGMDFKWEELIIHNLIRLKGFFLAPIGEDMNHVILAWGSIAVLFFLLLWVLGGVLADFIIVDDSQKELNIFLKMVMIPFVLLNLISLFKLDQVDGNYFMFLYFLIILAGMIFIDRIRSQGVKRIVQSMLIPIGIYNLVIISLTSWSWTTSFTPISWKHSGYYNHLLNIKEQIQGQGNAAIWKLLSGNPRTRVIVVGKHPDMLLFPCSTQSYEDITGSWGNVKLVSTMERFIEFMNYAGTDYIYMQAGHMEQGTRVYELMRYLIENGTLAELFFEDGNVLAKVDLEGIPGEQPNQYLSLFDQYYQIKEERGEMP